MDDNKISHKLKGVVDDVIKKIEKKFGQMSQTRGKKHEFLGMDIEFKKNKVVISVKKHIQKAMDMFSEEVTRTAGTPARSHLFDVDENVAKLDENR